MASPALISCILSIALEEVCGISFYNLNFLERYWERPQRCAPGTYCCNNQCANESDEQCKPFVEKDASRRSNLDTLLASIPGGFAQYLKSWNSLGTTWKNYIALPAIEYQTHEVYLNGGVVGVWNFGFVSEVSGEDGNVLASNKVIFPIYSDGSSAGSPIFLKISTDSDYSDVAFRYDLIIESTDTTLDFYKDYSKILSNEALTLVERGYYNIPIVPRGSSAQAAERHLSDFASACVNFTDTKLEVKAGWFSGNPVWFVNLDQIKSVDSPKSVIPAGSAVSDKYEYISVDAVDSIQGTPNYTGFYKVYRQPSVLTKQFDISALSDVCLTCVSRAWNARTAFVLNCTQ
ncbi:hypothetical protein HDU97_003532 [Phlyctochytrium planicorne]|nr:hypothetical protein HDU97_003532 [Phlyctochytrium planicorne]